MIAFPACLWRLEVLAVSSRGQQLAVIELHVRRRCGPLNRAPLLGPVWGAVISLHAFLSLMRLVCSHSA